MENVVHDLFQSFFHVFSTSFAWSSCAFTCFASILPIISNEKRKENPLNTHVHRPLPFKDASGPVVAPHQGLVEDVGEQQRLRLAAQQR